MSMMQEFKEFAVKGNVVDMGVGIVIGAAFTSIVNSFVADIVNPIIGVITGGIDFSNLFLNLGEGDYASLSAAQAAGAPTVNYGLFINAIISFLIVAFVLFIVIKHVNKLKNMAMEPEEEEAPEPSDEVKLLTEIRDALKKS
jgi:large conductance mechanosensitive channel